MAAAEADEHRAIIQDPVAWCRDHNTSADLEVVAARHHERLSLLERLRNVSTDSRALSRRIGEAKRAGHDARSLIAQKKTLSEDEKRLGGELATLEDAIITACRRGVGAAMAADGGPTPATHADGSCELSADAPFDVRNVDVDVDLDVDASANVDIAVLTDEDAPAWDRFVEASPEATVYHLSGWRHVVTRSFGHRTHYLLARRRAGDKPIVGILPLVQINSRLFGNYVVSMPYFSYGGVSSPYPVVRERLLEEAGALARRLGVSHIEFRDQTRFESLPARADKVSMRLELPSDPDMLWQSIGAKVRAQVKKAQRCGVTVQSGGIELLDDFYEVFAVNMRDLGTPVYSKHFFKDMLEREHLGRMQLVSAYWQGRPVSAAFLLGYRQQLEVPWASTVRSANAVNANMGLYWALLRHGCEAGYRIFDFGRSSRDAATYRFKKQWGARPWPLYWHYWLAHRGELPQLTPSNPKYQLAIAVWRRLPVWLTKVIGPGIVKNLP